MSPHTFGRIDLVVDGTGAVGTRRAVDRGRFQPMAVRPADLRAAQFKIGVIRETPNLKNGGVTKDPRWGSDLALVPDTPRQL